MGQSHSQARPPTPPPSSTTPNFIDYGSLTPSSGEDNPYAASAANAAWPYDARIVRALQLARKLPPFYKSLGDQPECVCSPATIISNEEDAKSVQGFPKTGHNSAQIAANTAQSAGNNTQQSGMNTPKTAINNTSDPAIKSPKTDSNPTKTTVSSPKTPINSSKPTSNLQQQALEQPPHRYSECPLCFLFYPNQPITRCCAQSICLPCFLHHRRHLPESQHPELCKDVLCPYCQQPQFGIIYTAPQQPEWQGPSVARVDYVLRDQPDGGLSLQTQPQGRKRGESKLSEVVTSDMIRPDFQERIDKVIAQQARRSNRRIIMRQIGGRMIPVGISSGSVSRRSRRLGNDQALRGADMEEMMVQEAMRLSLVEEEERQKRIRESEELEAALLQTSITGPSVEQDPQSSNIPSVPNLTTAGPQSSSHHAAA